MSWINRYVIGQVSPAWALRRERAARGLKAMYEAAESNRMHKRRSKQQSANAVNLRAADKLRSEARHFEENLDIAKGALDVLVANVVGTGIQPEPQVELSSGELAEEVNRELLRLWDDWIDSPDVTGQFDYYGLQQMTCRSWMRDGDVFGQLLMGSVPFLDHRTIVPYSIEMLEADFVPVDLNDESRGIVQGIELNSWGRPRAIYVYKTHPGDSGSRSSYDTKRVSSERLIHLKMVNRFHQVRGISVFASVINRLDDIKEIDESERVAARVAAAMAAFIKKGTPDMYEATGVDESGNPEERTMDWVPGMVFDDLQPGEDIGTIDPKRPNNALIPFRDSQLRSAAAGIGASYSSLSKNYNGTYSAQRQELVEQRVHYGALSGVFIRRFCMPVWYGFIDSLLATRALELPRDVNPNTIYNATHTPPPMPWIDPKKEAEANEILERRGYKSRSRIIRERGDNPDQVNRELQRDKAEAERLGLKFGEQAEQQPAQPQEIEE